MNIRLYKKSDLNTILIWCLDHKECLPYPEMLTTDSTFVLEKDNKPLACLTVYLTNSKEVAYLENLVRDPEFKGQEKDEAIKMLFNHVENFTKEQGFKRVVAFVHRPLLKNRFKEMNYINSMNDISSYVKELVE